MNEITELSKEESQPTVGCNLMYDFQIKEGILHMKTKDFWSEQIVRVGYSFGNSHFIIEHEDPFLAGELCPEQLERWRMLRLVKILIQME